jgi:type VI secretion system Hcp family effector
MKSLLLWATTALMGLAAQGALGSEVFLMQVPGVRGDVTLAGYAGWISVASFSASFSNAAANTSGAVTAGTPSCQPLQVIKPLDLTSPQLSMGVILGTAYPTVTFVALNQTSTGQTSPILVPFLRFTLSDAIVQSIAFAGTGASSAQFETLTLVYGQIEVSYLTPSSTGASAGMVSTTINCLTGTAN